MADWTANSGFGSLSASREPVVRAPREGAPRAVRPEREVAADPAPRVAPGVAALAQYNAAQSGPLAKAQLAVWAGGGVVSLLLVAGVGFWGYKLVLREVMGLPVVAAEEGPMRVLPADPGGEVVPSQGLAVNAIPAAGTVAPPSDVLVLAPPTPGLAEEDMEVVQTMAEADEVLPAAAAVPAPAEAAVVPTPAEPAPSEATLAEALTPVAVAAAPLSADPAELARTVVPPAPEAAVAAAPAASTGPADPAQPATLVATLLPADRAMTTEEILAFADQVAGQAQPLAPAAPAETAALPAPTPAPVAAAPGPIPADVPGVAVALKPPARPAALGTVAPAPAPIATAEAAPEAPVETPAPAPQTAASASAAVPAGTHLVQLGAFDSPEIAASEWARLQGAFGEFLGGRDHVVQETQSGGRTLYRLRVLGFPERADARILCAALTAEGADCIPVTVD